MIYIYIYIYSHPQTDLFRSIRRKFKRLWITIVIVYINPLNGYRELHLYEEPCIYANGNTITSFARELNPTGVREYIYIYIVINRQICFVLSGLTNAARQARLPKLGSKPGWLKRQSKILPLSHEETSASEGNLNGYESQLLLFTYIRLTATKSSIHMKSLAYTLMATQLLLSLESSTLQG